MRRSAAAWGLALARGEFTPKPLETFTAPIVAPADGDADALHRRRTARGTRRRRARRMASTALNMARQQRRGQVAWLDTEPGALAAATRIDLVCEGLTLAGFDGIHKSRPEPRFLVSDVTIVSGAPGAAAATASGRIVGDAINSARVLISEAATC